MAGVLSIILALVFVAAASLTGGLLLRREDSNTWKKFAYFSIACLVVAVGLFVFFLSSFN